MKLHFSGIGGNGMSALAQAHIMRGGKASGSDALLENGLSDILVFQKLREMGVKFFPQDASALAEKPDAVVLSSAIQPDNPEYKKARELGIPIIHRSELLAQNIEKYKTIAVSGTSGKSTVTALIFEILQSAGIDASIITGGPLLSLREKNLYGNVFLGKSDIMAFEADESDGSFLNYHPHIGLLLNISKDHKELPVLFDYFRKFGKNCAHFIYNADEENLAEFADKSRKSFGVKNGNTRATDISLEPKQSKFTIDGCKFTSPLTGLYNVYNCTAAISAVKELDVKTADCVEAIARYKGVYRRFNSLGVTTRGAEVIDDFAHNPAKIAAALASGQLRGKRVLAVYQPHGHTPVNLLKQELIEMFISSLRKNDILYLPDIYNMGPLPDNPASSKELADKIKSSGKDARYVPNRNDILKEISATAKDGDIVMIIGARDQTLADYAEQVFEALK